MSDPSPRSKPHPLSFELIQWARTLPPDLTLPPSLFQRVGALNDEERQQVLLDVAGFGAVLAQTDRPEPAILAWHAVRQLVEHFESARPALEKPMDMLRLGIALSLGDLDRLLELWPRLIPDAADHHGVVALLMQIQDIRERLKPRLGESRARALAVILLPVQSHTIVATARSEPWILSDECRTVLLELQTNASPELKEQILHMIAVFDDEAGRSLEAQARRQAGQQRAAQLASLSFPLRGLTDPEQILVAADSVVVPKLSSDEGEELVRALSEQTYETTADILPLWLAWRAAQQSDWKATTLASLAMDLMYYMKPLGRELAVARRRRILGEYALKHLPKEVPTEAVAMVCYGLTHTFVTLSEFEGDTLELLGGQHLYARRAMHLFARIHKLGFAAQCLDLMIAAQARLPEERGGGATGARKAVNELLATEPSATAGEQQETAQIHPLMRATLLTARARLRDESEALTGEAYERERADLDEAYRIFSESTDKHAREKLVRVCFFRASLELRRVRQGTQHAKEEAKRWSERGLDLIDAVDDPQGLALLAMTYLHSLRAQGEIEAASLWVHRALALKTLPPTLRAGLLVDRANLRLDSGEPLASGLQDIEAARTLLSNAPNSEQQWYLVRTEVELYRQHGQMTKALDAALRGLQTWETLFTPKHRTSLRAEIILLLQRSKRSDADQRAEAELDLLLKETVTAPTEALTNIQEGAWQWLYFQCLSSKDSDALRYTADRETALGALGERSAPSFRLGLGLLTNVWRGRATGEPSTEELLAQVEMALTAQPYRAQAFLGLGFYLARRETPERSPQLQSWAARLETHLLALKPDDGNTGAVDFLLSLALERLHAGSAPTLVNTQAAERLIAQAKRLFPVERLSTGLQQRLLLLDLRTSLRLLGLTPQQDPYKMVLDGQFLEREAARLPPDDSLTFLAELHHWLVSYAAVSAAPLREYAAQLRQNYGVGENDQEEAAELLDHGKLSKKDLRELQQLRELGVPKELAKNLLRGESLAQGAVVHAVLADEAQAVLMPLLGQCTAAQGADWRPLVTARVHRALGWMWMRHKSQDRREVLTSAIMHFEQATALWPMTDPAGFLDISEEHANALWQFEPTTATDRKDYADRARMVIRTALAHPQAANYPSEQAMLHRLLGLVEQHEERYLRTRDLERFRRVIGHHERALALAPLTETDLRFQILLTLANARRDYSDSQDGKQAQQELLNSAIDAYREALALGPKLRSTLPTETARAQKCLADALRMHGQPSDLDEARKLLQESLKIRTEQQFPIPRAESLLSLAQLEWACFQTGVVDALDAARRAAVECQTILAQGGNSAVETMVGALLRRIDHALSSTAVDATGRGRPGKPVVAQLLEEALQGSKDLPPLDPRLPRQMNHEGNIGDSALCDAMDRHISASFELRKEVMTADASAAHARLSQVLDIIEESVHAKDLDKAHRFILGVFGALCGNPQDFQPDERRRLADLTYRLLTPEYFASLSWQDAALFRHQAAHVLHGSWSGLSDSDWQWTEDAERLAVSVLETHAPADHFLPEFWKSLGLILWKRPYGAFQQRYREALDLFEKALNLARAQNQRTMALSLCNDIATLLDELAREEPQLRYRAISYYSQIIEQCEKGDGANDYHQMVLGNRGWSRINLPREAQPQGYRDAVADLEHALKICGDSPFLLRNRVHHYDHLGLAHSELVRYEKGHVETAVECFRKSIELARQLPDPIEESRALHNLGLLYLGVGEPEALEEAAECLWAALEPRRGRVKEEWETLGTLLAVRTRYQVPFGDMEDDEQLIAELTGLAPRLVESEDHDRALQTYDYIFELVRHRPGRTYRELIEHTDAALELADNAWSNAERPAAQYHYAQHIAMLAARRAFLACLNEEPTIDILNHSQRGKARTLRWHQAIQHGALPTSVRSYQAGQLAAIARLHASNRPEDRVAALRLETELHQRIKEYKPERQARLSPLTDDFLSTWLSRSPQTAVVDVSLTTVGGVITRAFLGRDGRLRVDARRIDLNLGLVQHWLRGDQDNEGWLPVLDRLGQVLSAPKQDPDALLDALDSAHALCFQLLPQIYERLAAPLTADLHAQGIVDLVVCLPGIVGNLPLAAACRVTADGTPRYLIEDFRSLKLTPSLDLLLRDAPNLRPPRRAVAILTEDTLPPAASFALERITSGWQTAGLNSRTLRAGGKGQEQASVAAVLQVLGESDLVHVLCHGSFDPHAPDASGVHLADEILSIDRLTSHPVPSPPRIVTLAACRSGRTSAQDLGAEWLGVSGALLRIGVRSVVAALWDVEVSATLRLYQDFYAAYLADAQDAGTALATAMRRQIAEGRAGEAGHAHPLTDAVPTEMQPRLRRLCASPIFWASLTVLQSG
mgnify:CR=1 FL=1